MTDPIYTSTDINEFKNTVNDLLNLKKYHVQCDVLTTTFSDTTIHKPVFVVDPTVWDCKNNWHDYTLDLVIDNTVKESIGILSDNAGPYGTTLYLSVQLSNNYFNKDDKSNDNIFSFILHVDVETTNIEKEIAIPFTDNSEKITQFMNLYTLTINEWTSDITKDARKYVDNLLKDFKLIKEVFNKSTLVLDTNLPSTLYKTFGQYDLNEMKTTSSIINRLRSNTKCTIFNHDGSLLYEGPQFLGHKQCWKYDHNTEKYWYKCHPNVYIEMSSYFDEILDVKCYLEQYNTPVSTFKFYMKNIDKSNTNVEFGISYNPDTLFKDCTRIPYTLIALYTRKIFSHLNTLDDFVKFLETPIKEFLELKEQC